MIPSPLGNIRAAQNPAPTRLLPTANRLSRLPLSLSLARSPSLFLSLSLRDAFFPRFPPSPPGSEERARRPGGCDWSLTCLAPDRRKGRGG
ncbi:hypothetical protein GUJ93_ZPchr0006g42285 [Zizania palustris]|uniref:Uncharacterized protein n=1 Tax=Zizania palustris TaxID=103762 RepID=A0A8J5T8X1_ZIZPA|nr:hypothetical protein GUJ93_ZPchr0006g42285 [Zizania palustris]